jgi:hypothetical protein
VVVVLLRSHREGVGEVGMEWSGIGRTESGCSGVYNG